jgi:hypothetical protein
MRVTDFRDGKALREVIAGMVTSDSVCGAVAAAWNGSRDEAPELFSSREANRIARWTTSYYNEHFRAPRNAMETIFEGWATTHPNKEEVKLTEELLREISDEDYRRRKKINPKHIVNLAKKLFDESAIRRAIEDAGAAVQRGKFDDARKVLETVRYVEMGPKSGTDTFRDEEAQRNAFRTERTAPLLTYPGDLGRFFGEQFARGNLVAFMGHEGIGKSHWLLDMVWRAIRQRCKVCFFDAGDMSEEQVDRRLLVRASRHPALSSDGRWPVKVKMPNSIKVPEWNDGEDQTAEVTYDNLEFEEPLDFDKAHASCERLIQKVVRSDAPHFWRTCRPSGTLSVRRIREELRDRIKDGMVFDVVVIDYADLLMPMDRKLERRDQINADWIMLRSIAQEFSCLVVTATQVNRTGYKARTLRMEHVGEDKRKLAHVSAMFCINATDAEREMQVQRLSQSKKREGGGSQKEVVHVANCLALGNPCVMSMR